MYITSKVISCEDKLGSFFSVTIFGEMLHERFFLGKIMYGFGKKWIGLTKQKDIRFIGNTIYFLDQIVTKIRRMTSFFNISLCREQ